MESKITAGTVILCVVLLFIVAGAGFVGGYLARGGESASERARAERYLADYRKLESRVVELAGALADAEKHVGESDAIIADLRSAAIELAKIKRELEIGFDASLKILDRIDGGVIDLEKGFRSLPADGGGE